MDIQKHPDEEVRRAIIKLTDALYAWERNTGLENVLIIRGIEGFEYRAINGKPIDLKDLEDGEIMANILNKH